MLMRLRAPSAKDLPPVGTIVPFDIGGRADCAKVVEVSNVGDRPVVTLSMPGWVVDHLDHAGRRVYERPPDGSGRAKWHQTRTAHGALPASKYVSL